MLLDHLSRDIAELLSVAAEDADVVLTTYTERSGNPDFLLAEALVQRLVHTGDWTFVRTANDAQTDENEAADDAEVSS